MNKLTFVLFGSTGNLAIEKIFPAIEKLLHDKLINIDFKVIAVGRKNYTDLEYYSTIKSNLHSDILKDKIRYLNADMSCIGCLEPLSDYLTKNNLLNSDIIYYYSVSSEYFSIISKQLKNLKLIKENSGFRRAVFEKPFGEDYSSSKKILSEISSYFNKNQIYFVDHYLGKEAIQNIIVLRSLNTIFSSTWSSKYIQNIEINIIEKDGIGSRGQYYDRYGVVKDMFQNHIIQIVSFLGMDLDKKEFLKNKIKAIKSIKIDKFSLGQYEGYTSELHVKKNSKTPTFLDLKLTLNSGVIKNVPILIKTGKKFKDKYANIIINFKPEKNFYNDAIVPGNKLIINIQPTAKIETFFNHKVPGISSDISQVSQSFCRDDSFIEKPKEGYERLIYEVIIGRKLLFVSSEEILESWKIVDKLNVNKKLIKY